MITDVTPTKIYRLKNEGKDNLSSKNYNMIVIEDCDGDIQHLLLSDHNILKCIDRAKQCSDRIPKYTLRLCCGTTGYFISLFLSLVVGVATGYFLGF